MPFDLVVDAMRFEFVLQLADLFWRRAHIIVGNAKVQFGLNLIQVTVRRCRFASDQVARVNRCSCDDTFAEPEHLVGDDWVEFALRTCRERRIDVFVPGRERAAVDDAADRFAAAGVAIMTGPADAVGRVCRLPSSRPASSSKSSDVR